MTRSRTRSRTTRGPAALTLVLAVGPGCLTACGGDPAEELTERAVERAAGGDVDVEADGDGNLSITSDEGSFSATTGELPDGFPDVPLLDGEIISAVSMDQGSDTGWTVSMLLDGDPETLLEEAVDLLEDAGFSAGENARAPGLAAAQVSDAELDVFLTALPGDGVTVTYTVTRVQG